MSDHPGPWRRATIAEIIDQASKLRETDRVLAALLSEADDAQLMLLKLSLLAAQRRANDRLLRAAQERVRPVYRPPAT